MCQEAAEETAFQTLPVDLQQWVFARAGAPFNTGKAAAAVAKDASLLAVWLTASVQHPLLTASQLKAWDTCTALLSSSSSYLPSEYDLFHATVYASEAGQLELVHSLISRGAWQAWLWGETDAHLSLPVDDHYLNNSIWDRLKHITSAKEIDEARAVVRLRHPLVGAAANGHLEVCRLLLAKGVHARAARKALLAAAKYGHLPVVRLLLLEVPDTGTVPCVGCNPIEFAAEGGHLAVVQLLVQQGVDIEAAQWALCGAAREGHLEVVQYLVKALVAVSGQYAAQKALYCAAERNHLQVSADL
jgi:ankyrin repeat protein